MKHNTKEETKAKEEKATQEKQEAGEEKAAQKEAEAGEEKTAQEKTKAEEEKATQEKAEAGEEKAAQEKAEAEEEKAAQEKAEAEEEKTSQEEAEAGEEKAAQEKAEAKEEKVAQEKQEKVETKGAGKANPGKKRKKARGPRIFVMIAAALTLSALLFLYLGGAFYYREHFFPNTRINGVDCGNRTVEEAEEALQQWYTQDYSLLVEDENGTQLLLVRPSDCEMVFSADGEAPRLLEEQNAYAWVKAAWAKTPVEDQVSINVTYNEEVLRDNLSKTELFTHKGEAPQDAYISEYEEADGCYRIVAEKEGSLLEEEKTVICIGEALTEMKRELNLRESGCYVRPEVDSQNAQLRNRLEQLNRIVGTCITYDWNGNEEILDGSIIHNWIVEKDGEILLDEEQIAAYVEEKAKAYDTYGTKRKFVTALGVELTLSTGSYGWRTDREAEAAALTELILSGAVTEREPEYRNRGWVKGMDDIGDSYVEIDLTHQHLYLYQDGELVLETDFVSGNVAKGNATPPGIFGLSYKTKDAVLRGETYESHVKYWMPFNGNIGMHDASWRKTFGGDIYLTNGSHGCVNLPLSQAKTIYGYVSEGFPIICYYY